tara:strand:- start:549 stop:1418 length:870 start_codon:yes stop_codon:yes gene_type:complete
MSYELDSIEYKGFTIRIVNDESPDEPDWGDPDFFLTCLNKKYRFGRAAETNPEDHMDWGEGPWGEWNELLAQHGVKTPPESWNTTVGGTDKSEAYDLYQQWQGEYDNTYLVWPFRCGDAHGAGSFTIWVMDKDEECHDRAHGWVYVKHPGTPLEELANLHFDAEKIRDGLIETYQQWANGDVWGYIIQNSDGEDVEDGSCWGYYGSDDCIEQAKVAADCIVGSTRKVRFILLSVLAKANSWEYLTLPIPVAVGNAEAAQWVMDNSLSDHRDVHGAVIAAAVGLAKWEEE